MFGAPRNPWQRPKMNRYLPTAWVVLAAIAALMSAVAASPLFGSDYHRLALPKMSGVALSAIYVLTLAGIYALLNRVTARRLVFRLGWVHLAFQFVQTVAGQGFQFATMTALIAGERIPAQSRMVWTIVVSAALIGATLIFFAVILAALRDVRERIELQIFD